MKVLLGPLKTLTNSKYSSQSLIRISIQLFSFSVDRFPSLLLCYWSIFFRDTP